MAKYINKFTTVPKELFRLNNGPAISLRDRTIKKLGSYDVLTEAGKVKAKAANPQTYAAPNGASLRPNTPTQQKLVKDFKGASIVVYAIPEGTKLPSDLVIVHESNDHYSLQPAKDMDLKELNTKINNFLTTYGKRMTKSEWQDEYPKATETS
ncbi:hypothetical protein PMZ80_011264 [Knufia obscura]|uniref:Tse2 ADP-ribosyltransferase toxin domain-containing protein n=1 Tax=Knufia obscura TaxID=1635080 RepID=A0ABR0R7A5_9EURO|nr:hypothetical protein PMZ80_011264 [Knufia obscura]